MTEIGQHCGYDIAGKSIRIGDVVAYARIGSGSNHGGELGKARIFEKAKATELHLTDTVTGRKVTRMCSHVALVAKI